MTAPHNASSSPAGHHWVASNRSLKALCEQLQSSTSLAIDTEFMRTNTYFPKLALIQLSDGDQCWLIDVLAIDQFSPLKQLLESPQRVLIFHAPGEDFEVLDHALSIVPTNIFDTQVAAGLVNIGYSMGYARLVAHMFDIELGKEDTRSDWMARPLSDRQKRYAADDVLYLHRLYQILQDQLVKQQRQSWFDEEMDGLLTIADQRKRADDYYLRIKGAWRLQGSSLAVLKDLCDWRESTARSLDKPRSHIVKDNVLLELANSMPTTMGQLHRIDDWYSRSVKRFGNDVLQLISEVDQDDIPEGLPQPLSRAVADVMKKMRSKLSEVAEDHGIPKEFMCNKKELESILRSAVDGDCQWPSRLTDGWRVAMVTPALQSVIDSSDSL
jgi:ribonuclease D